MQRDQQQHGCPGSQSQLSPGYIRHRERQSLINEQQQMNEHHEDFVPHLDRQCVVYSRNQAIHIQPPQLIEKIGQFLVYSCRSVTESTCN